MISLFRTPEAKLAILILDYTRQTPPIHWKLKDEQVQYESAQEIQVNFIEFRHLLEKSLNSSHVPVPIFYEESNYIQTTLNNMLSIVANVIINKTNRHHLHHTATFTTTTQNRLDGKP